MASAQSTLNRIEESLEKQKLERYDVFDSFMEGLDDRLEAEEIKPQNIVQELTNNLRSPIRLSPTQVNELIEHDASIENEVRKQIENFLTTINIVRIVGALTIRIENLEIKPNDLQGKNWEEMVDVILDAIEDSFEQRKSQLLGKNGQFSQDIESWMKQIDTERITQDMIYRMMIGLQQGYRLGFDKKSHRQVRQKFLRLNYVYYAAQILRKFDNEHVSNWILDHMMAGIDAIRSVWGVYEVNRLKLAQANLSQLDDRSRNLLSEQLGSDHLQTVSDVSISDLAKPDLSAIQNVLGDRVRNEIYRELLLSIISQMWVEYLTRMEALRISIGMEAYAQRDPLVQYKSQASELFRNLLIDIRSALVNRMFTYRPSQRVNATIDRDRPVESDSEKQPELPTQNAENKKKKRRRH